MGGELVAETNAPNLKNIIAPRNWLSLSVRPLAFSRYREEAMQQSKEKRPRERSNNIGGTVEVFIPSKRQRMTLDLSLSLSTLSYEEEEEGHNAIILFRPESEESQNINNDRTVTERRRGWFETMTRIGMGRPVLCLRKRATKSDASRNQHRLQLRNTDVDNALQPLKDLAQAAKENVVPVIVLDGECNTYDMMFKYLASSKTYRFMGRGYTNFLSNNNLQENSIVNVWVLPQANQGQGASWLAFIVSD